MVFNNSDRSHLTSPPVLAPVVDRFLAFGFDLCLWVPLEFLLLKPFVTRFEYLLTASPGGSIDWAFSEIPILMLLLFLLATNLFILPQALMMRFASGTPGQKIFKIRVQNWTPGMNLSLGQCLLRSTVWVIEVLFLGLPLLEILSHPFRRPWHDRISESIVVSEKKIESEPPHWVEQRFFRSFYWGILILLVVSTWAGVAELLQLIERGDKTRNILASKGYFCSKLSEKGDNYAFFSGERMDYALALYVTGQLDRECIEKEADFIVWIHHRGILPWAHLARGVLAEPGLPREKSLDISRSAEFAKACSEGKDEIPCQLTHLFENSSTGAGEDSSLASAEKLQSSLLARISVLLSHFRRGEFGNVLQKAQSGDWPSPLGTIVQGMSLQALWLARDKGEFLNALGFARLGWAEPKDRIYVEGWSCLAELADSCGHEVKSRKDTKESKESRESEVQTCGFLRHDVNALDPSQISPMVALALAREASCSNRYSNSSLLRGIFEQYFRRDQEETAWISEWIDPRFPEGSKEKWNFVYSGASKSPHDDWLRAHALSVLVSLARNNEEMTQVRVLFEEGTSTDPFWWIARRRWEKKAEALGLRAQMKLRVSSSSQGDERSR